MAKKGQYSKIFAGNKLILFEWAKIRVILRDLRRATFLGGKNDLAYYWLDWNFVKNLLLVENPQFCRIFGSVQ